MRYFRHLSGHTRSYWRNLRVRQLSVNESAAAPETLSLDQLVVTDTVRWLQDFVKTVLLSLPCTAPVDVSAYFDVQQHPTVLSVTMASQRPFTEITSDAVKNLGEDWERVWRQHTVRAVTTHMGIDTHGYILPDALWQLLGLKAWANPNFAYELAQKLEATLSCIWLYPAGNLPVAQFHVNTLWLLLAGIPYRHPDWSVRRTGIGAELTPDTFLMRVGERLADSEGWADYWDQWALMMAYQKWQKQARWTAVMRAKIEALPLIKTPDYWRGKHPFLPIDWGAAIPDWFKILVEAGIYKTQVREQ